MLMSQAQQKKKKEKEKRFKTMNSLKRTLYRDLRGEERKKGTENIFQDIIAENFPNPGKGTDIQLQEAQRVPNKANEMRSTLRLTVIKMAKIKDKERLLKVARVKQQVT